MCFFMFGFEGCCEGSDYSAVDMVPLIVRGFIDFMTGYTMTSKKTRTDAL